MQDYQIVLASLDKANLMSDHRAQVNPKARMVSQNLQGPYAIRKTKTGFWLFDLPDVSDVPAESSQVEYKSVKRKLVQLTGLSDKDSEDLLDAMIEDNKNAVTGKAGYATTTLLDRLKNTYSGIGEEFDGRISIESNLKYQARTNAQIGHLKNSLQPNAAVLMFQKQPYDAQADRTRATDFIEIMATHQYRCVASTIGRNVGIWVASQFAVSFKKPNDPELVSMIEGPPFRGCVTQGLDTIYINLYGSAFDIPFDTYIAKLCDLSKAVNRYAKNRKLKICLNGDLTLHGHLLNENHIKDLRKAGFILSPAKGHEPKDGKAKKNPTMEGWINDGSYYQQRPDIAAAPNFAQIKTRLHAAWKKVEESLDYDPGVPELIAKFRLPNFTNYQGIQTRLNNSAALNLASIKNMYEQIQKILETKTVRYMTTPTLYGALVDFKVQVASAHAAATPPDNETHAIMEGVLDEFKKFMSNRTSQHARTDTHDGLDEIHSALETIKTIKNITNPYQKTVASLMIIANKCRERLNHKYNFFHQITRDNDVANIYDLFNNNSLLELDNDQLKYNTKGLETILVKLESLNRSFDRVKEAYQRAALGKRTN